MAFEWLKKKDKSMNIKQLSADFAVSGQISPDEVSALAGLGYKSIICNRPDAEVEATLAYAAVEAAAKAAGMEIRYIPIIHRVSGMDEVHQTVTAMDELPKPIFAYCRSGARSETFYNAAMQLA